MRIIEVKLHGEYAPPTLVKVVGRHYSYASEEDIGAYYEKLLNKPEGNPQDNNMK